MLKRRSRLLLAFAVLTAGAGIVLADDTRKPADPATDDELLEFLGSVDPASDTLQPDDGAWIEYLSQTDIGKVTAKPGNPTVIAARPPTPQQSPPPKPNAPGAKQNE